MNVSLTTIVPTQQFVKIQNVAIPVKLPTSVEKMPFVEPSAIQQHVVVLQTRKVIRNFHVIQSNVLTITNATLKNRALTQNVSIHVLCKMLVVIMPFAQLKIMLEFAHVNQELLEIHFLGAHKFNIAALTNNVHRVRNVIVEFARQSAQVLESVSQINFASRAFVSQLVTATQLAPISNSAKIISAYKNQNA